MYRYAIYLHSFFELIFRIFCVTLAVAVRRVSRIQAKTAGCQLPIYGLLRPIPPSPRVALLDSSARWGLQSISRVRPTAGGRSATNGGRSPGDCRPDWRRNPSATPEIPRRDCLRGDAETPGLSPEKRGWRRLRVASGGSGTFRYEPESGRPNGRVFLIDAVLVIPEGEAQRRQGTLIPEEFHYISRVFRVSLPCSLLANQSTPETFSFHA